MLYFCDFIQVYVFTTNHHLKQSETQTNFLECDLDLQGHLGRRI